MYRLADLPTKKRRAGQPAHITVATNMAGRSSRQGDPGTFRIYVSFDDEILKLGFGDAKSERLRKKYEDAEEVHGKNAFRYSNVVQTKVERRYTLDRLILSRREEQRQKSLAEAGIAPFLNSLDDWRGITHPEFSKLVYVVEDV